MDLFILGDCVSDELDGYVKGYVRYIISARVRCLGDPQVILLWVMLGVDDELAEDASISTGQPLFELDRDYRYSAEWNTVSLQ
jgi:hypothetical protein